MSTTRRSFLVVCMELVLGVCGLVGCSKATVPAPPITVAVVATNTNANGEVLVQLSLTNRSANEVLMGVRSAVYRAQGSWITNFSVRPHFTGMAGPGSEASDVMVAAGGGMTVWLSPLKVPSPFQLEFVCFPSRSGIAGVMDDARDKIEQVKDGSPHESFLGESFFVLSPMIDPL